MRVSYDKEHDILALSTGQPQLDGASLYDYVGAAVLFGTDGGQDIVGVETMAASYWFGKGYDSETDTWVLGDTTEDTKMITEDGDFIGYWKSDEVDAAEVPDVIGVAIRNVSKHLGVVKRSLETASLLQPSES